MRRNPPARWVLPETIDPVGRKCIEVQVPDDPAHIAAFRGALLALASAYNWADDPEHKAKGTALVWREIIDGMTDWGCTLQTKVRVDDICTLSWSYDDWATFDSYDPSACILANIDGYVPGLINDIIDGLIADGTLQRGGGQPGPTEPPIEGTCKSYHVVLRGNDRWLIPSPINTNDTVVVTNAVGGWNDGTFAWCCPDGSIYILGACGDPSPYQPGDPIQSGTHMRIILGYDESTPTYGDCMDTAFVVPNGVTNQEAWLQANDGSLEDNNGQVEFDVEICSAGWCHKFDFTADDYDFLGTYGETYSAGNGWYHGSTYVDSVYIYSPLFDEIQLTAMTIEISTPMSGGRNLWRFKVNGTNADTSPNYTVADGAATQKTWTTSPIAATRIAVGIEKSVGNTPSYDGYIKSITLRGTGTNPWGSSNC